jgi:Leucine-rich repeat (LRR) protein
MSKLSDVNVLTKVLFSIDDLETFVNFCKSVPAIRPVCEQHRESFCKKFLEKYHVNYRDPHNFIYVVSKKNIKEFFQGTAPDYLKIFKYFYKWFNHDIIGCPHLSAGSPKITSIPAYPNVKELDCSYNDIKKLSDGMLKLEKLHCSHTNLTALPQDISTLRVLDCRNTRIKLLSKNYSSLETLICNDSAMSSLPSTMSNLMSIFCSNSKIKELPNGMGKLQILKCENNGMILVHFSRSIDVVLPHFIPTLPHCFFLSLLSPFLCE